MRPPDRGPVVIDYKFDLPDYVKYDQNEMYINLNMDKGLILEKLTEGRKVPVEMKNKTQKRLVTILNIPKGYEVEYMPPNINVNNEIEGFSSTYQLLGSKLIHICDFYINTLILQPSEFEKYNAVITQQVKAYNQAVSFKKKSTNDVKN